ncbi:ankyrin repeat domain-containing protein [Lichenicola sp.]|uniref:ankyrin repeat domain-containing protein n=1 Tax=Lichenicola sp. TaxID=2804529 RepID=UPI003AFFF96A
MDLRRTLRLTFTVLLLGAAPALIPLHGAHAQFSASGGPGAGGGGGGGSDAEKERDAADAAQAEQAKQDARLAAPPPAIPGAVTDEATATSGHASVDMEPTAALFDAINRGDITAAKEALGRGADLNGKNVLGQSPLDMAIDLNRNDITFVLLSMRNSEQGAPVASVQTASDDLGDSASSHAKAGHPTAKSRSSRYASASHTGSVPGPTRYASDGGSPKPDIGFLGFGGS